MARKWQNQDSARTMTNKFNEVVDDIKSLFSAFSKLTGDTEKILSDTQASIDEKLNATNIKTTIGLEKVDNTSDVDKPVSNAQKAAIEVAVKDVLYSEDIGVEIRCPDVSILNEILGAGTSENNEEEGV